MEDIELKNIWKAAADQQLEQARLLNLQSWAVNLRTFEYLQTHKAKSKLDSLATFKVWVALLGVVWVLFLGILVYGNRMKNPYFTISVACILLFNVFAVAIYIKHIVLIRQIDYSQSITATQKKLTELQASTINVARILFLQTPFFCTWFWHKSWIDYSSLNFWLIIFPITLLFTLMSLWLYRNISLRNAGKKWFRILFGTREWTNIIEASNYLKEIEDFRDR